MLKQEKAPLQDDIKSKKHLLVFKLLSILLVFIVFVLIEFALKIFGYGHNMQLFVESELDKSCWVMNQYASNKFFIDDKNSTVGYIEPFNKEKGKDTYRIFVLGESTTVGFPYRNNGSFHRWLKYRLMFTFPEVNFEIINLSLTAVNSYTILDFSKEIINYNPDAVLIYVGHNEYYGALGVGSTSSLGDKPFIINSILKLRELRLFQLLSNSYINIRKNISGKQINESEGLMARMPAEKSIPLNSEKYKSGINQFKNNINEVCKILSEENIPTFISNLVSNECDLPPFISDSSNIENSAINSYNKGLNAYKDGAFNKAKDFFIEAKELDLLRFRAPKAINDEISDVCSKYNDVHFVDALSYFEKNSPHGIIGENTMLEHVHPNLFGYAILSDAFYDAIKKESIINGTWTDEMSFNDLLENMPVTIIDSMRGDYAIRFMKNAWPFTYSPVKVEELIKNDTELDRITHKLVFEEIKWAEAISKLNDYYLKDGNYLGSAKIAEAIALVDPKNEQLLKTAAVNCLRLKNYTKAIFYIQKGFQLNPTYEAAQQLSGLLLDNDNPQKAIKYMQFMHNNSKSESNLAQIIKISENIVSLKEDHTKNKNNINLLNSIAYEYLKIGSTQSAKKYVGSALLIDSKNKTSHKIVAGIKQIEQLKATK